MGIDRYRVFVAPRVVRAGLGDASPRLYQPCARQAWSGLGEPRSGGHIVLGLACGWHGGVVSILLISFALVDTYC
jgi:hypothetical protein